MIKFEIDLSEILSLANMENQIKEATQAAGDAITKSVHAKLTELAEEELDGALKEKYIAGLNSFQVSESEWCVTLDKSAAFIEEGASAYNMISSMLKSKKAKHGKNGTYIDIPFQQNKGGSKAMSPAQASLWGAIKKELQTFDKDDPLRLKNVAMEGGKPKQGLIGSFNVDSGPINRDSNPIGKGPKGKVAQGHSGIPLLQGVKVFQSTFKNKKGQEKTGKVYMTFRRISSNSTPPAWDNPGIKAANLFDKAIDWSSKEINDKAIDQIVKSIK